MISEGQRPLWQRVLAALLYTCIVVLIVYFFTTMQFSIEEKYLKAHFGLFEICGLLFMVAYSLSVTINYYFNFNENLFKRGFSVGVFRYGKWKQLPKLDYISIFDKNDTEYHISLWYNTNKHFKIFRSSNLEDVFKIGIQIAEKLNIALLDSTRDNDYRWVNKNVYKEKGEIEYLK